MKRYIQQLLERVLDGLGLEEIVSNMVSVHENPAHGDFSTNVALKMPNPRKFAEELKNTIQKDQTISRAGIIDRVEIAGPGFLNLYLSEASLVNQVGEVLKKGKAYGFSPKSTSAK